MGKHQHGLKAGLGFCHLGNYSSKLIQVFETVDPFLSSMYPATSQHNLSLYLSICTSWYKGYALLGTKMAGGQQTPIPLLQWQKLQEYLEGIFGKVSCHPLEGEKGFRPLYLTYVERRAEKSFSVALNEIIRTKQQRVLMVWLWLTTDKLKNFKTLNSTLLCLMY